MREIIDLFAGPGGWSEGLRSLGFEALGIERDPRACETASAAGHRRLCADVAALGPRDLDPPWGLLASPPYPSHPGAGRRVWGIDQARILARARRLAGCEDVRSLLALEPLRFALSLRPRWIALEQVPAAGDLLSFFAAMLRERGYFAVCGPLSAERFGLAQLRERVFLLASLDGEVFLPAPTHRRFESRRHSSTEAEDRLPGWVSMARALGRPGPEVLRTGRGDREPTTVPRSLELPAPELGPDARRWTICPRPGGAPARIGRGRPVRLSVEGASVLQGFRHDYPWRGSRAERFEQIGNAVPPPLAARVLAEVMRPTLDRGGEWHG